MKKLSFLTISQLVVIFVLIFAAQVSMAKMTSLSDDELSEVTAQAGIAVEIDELNLDAEIDTLYYHDKDGVGEGTTGGYLSLNGVEVVGSIVFDDPITVDVQTQMDAAGNKEVTSVNMAMSDMTIDIERFTIDSITLGSEAGEGKSLGSIGIYGLHARITGNVNISSY